MSGGFSGFGAASFEHRNRLVDRTGVKRRRPRHPRDPWTLSLSHSLCQTRDIAFIDGRLLPGELSPLGEGPFR